MLLRDYVNLKKIDLPRSVGEVFPMGFGHMLQSFLMCFEKKYNVAEKGTLDPACITKKVTCFALKG